MTVQQLTTVNDSHRLSATYSGIFIRPGPAFQFVNDRIRHFGIVNEHISNNNDTNDARNLKLKNRNNLINDCLGTLGYC